MKILFTKNIDTKLVENELGSSISADYLQVIETTPLSVASFDLKNYSLIFTSKNGVEAFFKNKFQPNEDFTSKNYNKIYCVGEKTKKELRKNGFGTFKVLKNAETLSQFIIEHCPNEKFFHFCGNLALDVLDKELPLQNISYQKIIVYNTQELYSIVNEKYNAIVFFSPSGVRSFVKNNSLDKMEIFSIGETTSKEIRKHIDTPIYTSKDNTLISVLEIMQNEINKRL